MDSMVINWSVKLSAEGYCVVTFAADSPRKTMWSVSHYLTGTSVPLVRSFRSSAAVWEHVQKLAGFPLRSTHFMPLACNVGLLGSPWPSPAALLAAKTAKVVK